MTRQLRSTLALILIAITVSTGCTPTQPFYFHEDGDLSHYLDQATELEHPDVYRPLLEDVEFAGAPLTISDPEFKGFWELQLEEVVSIALQNSKLVRNLGGVTPFGFADALVGRNLNASTIYDTAIVESDPNNGVEAALAEFDAQLAILGSEGGNNSIVTHTDRVVNQIGDDAINPGNPFNNGKRGGLEAALTKSTASGLRLRAGSRTNRVRSNPFLAVRHRDFWEQTFDIQATMPLLRGRGAMINRIPVVLARINADVSLARFESSVRNLVMDIENTYWDLHAAYRNLETAKIGRDSAQVTWNNVYEKKNAGVESAQAEAQSREQYFFFRASLESALRELYNIENRLRYLMGIAATDGRLIRPSDEPSAARLAFDWRQIHNEALIRSAELRQQKWVIEQRELQLVAAKNQLLPQLDVGAVYRWYGAGNHLINSNQNRIKFEDLLPAPFPPGTPNPNSNAFDVLTGGQFQEAAVTFEFQMPVGYRRELAGVRNAQLNLTREKSRLEDMELNTSHLLTTAVRDLDFNYVSAQTHFNRWKASQAEVDSVDALYRSGKTTLDLVLDAQRRRAQAQIDYYRALTEYNKSIAFVHFQKGSLLEYNNVMLAEGPWPEKAYWDALGRARERDASYYLNYGWSRPGVSSQGPVSQHIGDMPRESVSDEELIPTPQPTPADRPEAGDDAPQEPGPITTRPEGPELNAPRRAAAGGSDLKVATQPANAFDWSGLGLDGPIASEVQPASFEE